jgi:hypothetical protein
MFEVFIRIFSVYMPACTFIVLPGVHILIAS